jgi:hypothetical protein
VLRWRAPAARWLLLLSVTPQRIWHDQLLLYVLPTSRLEMLLLIGAGWLMWVPFALWRDPDPGWVVDLFYLPALAIVLWPVLPEALRHRRGEVRPAPVPVAVE